MRVSQSRRAEKDDQAPKILERGLNSRIWNSRFARWVVVVIGLAILVLFATTPLDFNSQLVLAVVMFFSAVLFGKFVRGRYAILVLVLFSIAASARYMYWRITETLGFESTADFFFGYGLLGAEIYAVLVLLLGYYQSAWPLGRQPVLMLNEPEDWPTVDVFIPTYNEALDIVRPSILASLSLDWPRDKLNIYVLDDGNREEFKQFCQDFGVGYIARENNVHFKAGNINHALAKTDGEFVAVFDCDHIPTRSFLQISMGWFSKDSKLAMLQTPHVFLSPDPIEQNLDVFLAVPNEGQLFYGLIQDGNDLWNASFFCGSCAVLRRSSLEQIGGIAVESVTEDALTALKLNEAGFNTAYLALPQAAGLATENLSRHIGQRIRWARGMAQIFRLYNPIFRKGLSLAQRICYSSAALHFFYGLPRLVFLTGPLAYLFFGAKVFQASALAVAVYVGPHILHAYYTNRRIQGRYRHTLWNEVYETVLAWYVMRPTIATYFFPDRATFTVTAKGATTHEAYFDWVLARPYIILFALNVAGVVAGLIRIGTNWGDTTILLTVLLNLAWTLHNIVISSASVAVAGERQQLRSHPRIRLNDKATIQLLSGHRIPAQLTDYSQNGLGLQFDSTVDFPPDTKVYVSLYRDELESVFPASVVFSAKGRLGLRLDDLTPSQQAEFAQLTFARADMWVTSWYGIEADSPIDTIKYISSISARGVRLLASESWAAVTNSLSHRKEAQVRS